MGKLSVYTLGYTGVVIDFNTLDPSVPVDALTLAQNVLSDNRAGHMGGIRKRPGLKIFNLVNAGAAILGGIPMPVAGFGGAPSSGGGGNTGDVDDGSSVGTGSGIGAGR